MSNFDVVINVSVYNTAHATSFTSSYSLKTYKPLETATPFQQLKKDVCTKSQGLQVNWIGVSLMLNGFSILTMKGNLEWFEKVEFFKKYISDGGGTMADQPDGFGLIDLSRNFRVEFERGQVLILPA